MSESDVVRIEEPTQDAVEQFSEREVNGLCSRASPLQSFIAVDGYVVAVDTVIVTR